MQPFRFFVTLALALSALTFIACAPATSGGTVSGTQTQRDACTTAGGSVVVKSACLSASAFANNCSIGAYGCAPASSHNIETCQCSSNQCWDGSTCQSPAPACVETGTCVAANSTLKCCDTTKTVKDDPTNCPVASGTIGGQPWSCQ